MHVLKINKILLGLVIVLLIALGVSSYWQKRSRTPVYSAVYMETGELYVGELVRFPRMILRDVWLLQKEGEPQSVFGLSKFEHAFWGPKDEMIMNDEKVVWVAELKKDSEVVRAIQGSQIGEPVQSESAILR